MGIYDRSYYREEEQVLRIRPWDHYSMVTNLIIVNVVLYLANFLFTNNSNSLTAFLALWPESLTSPLDFYRCLTFGFAHSPDSPFHILFNMASLYFLGPAVESKYGRAEFLRFYLISIVLGGVFFCLRSLVQGTQSPVIGASGAVCAVSMLFVFCFPHAQLMLLGVLPVSAWVLGIIMVVTNITGNQGIGLDGSKQVAYDVHLAGIFFAAVYFYAGLDFGSISKFWKRVTDRAKAKKIGVKVHRPETTDESRADELLDKIHRLGQDSLTAKERQFMEEYSRSVRQKREK